MLKRLWKRYVAERPDEYQAYISLPTESSAPTMGALHDLIQDAEFAFEGRLDVYARRRRLAVVTDRVPHETFDTAAFDAVIETLESLYEAHAVARVEKWRSVNGRLVKTYVVVPVKPLFSKLAKPKAARPAVR
ncbi:hypothetical protein [Natronosalvus halobius]|uniref:hypothetical protein n=1 Tax=Natronosalvus halobius TaxID=2953746 RepID=UPI0020A0C25B|nr:hypothetical protein [Natronosalvus halobius]USZ70796.1 hypothetical protein NGM15_11880 [Natronosalvus halobius]